MGHGRAVIIGCAGYRAARRTRRPRDCAGRAFTCVRSTARVVACAARRVELECARLAFVEDALALQLLIERFARAPCGCAGRTFEQVTRRIIWIVLRF